MNAPVQPNGLNFVIDNEWYDNFLICREVASESIDQIRAESRAKHDEEERTRNAAVLTKIDDLVNDNSFARLPTQRAMLAYARDLIVGIEDLDETTLKGAISGVWAKIKARGL
jgi:hypothetical protein